MRLSLGGQTLEALDIPQLDPGASTTVEFTAGPFEVGNYTLDLTLDPDGEIEELQEGNNSASRSFRVTDQRTLSLGESVTVQSSVAGPVFLFRVEITEASDEALNVVLSGGSGDADLFVHYGERPGYTNDYRCSSGNEDTNEMCQLTPTRVGYYHIGVLAFAAFGPSVLEVTVGGRDVKGLDIELVFLDNGTTSQENIVRQAAERWEQVIGDLDDFPYFSTVGAFPAHECFPGQPAVSDAIDDIRVWVSILDSIDGVGGLVARSGPCHFRSYNYGFGPILVNPTLGAIFLDAADVAQAESQGMLPSLVTHELAHVLGFLPLMWKLREMFQNPSRPNRPNADTHFTGPLAVEAFDAVGGVGYTAGAKVPLQNGAEDNIADWHWRESVFGDELMTPYLTGDTQPLSLVTIESLYDIWYEVNLNAADPFSLSSAGRAGMAIPRGPFIDLSNDVASWPIHVSDQKGRLVSVIYPGRR